MMDNELATKHSDLILRRHVSDLLSVYVSQHITIDHVQYLQDITSEVRYLFQPGIKSANQSHSSCKIYSNRFQLTILLLSHFP